MTEMQPELPGIGRVYDSVPILRRGDWHEYERHLVLLAIEELEPDRDRLTVADKSQEAVRKLTRDIHLRHFPAEEWYGGSPERTWRRHRDLLNRWRALRGLAPKLDVPGDPALKSADASVLLHELAARDREIAEMARVGERKDVELAVAMAENYQLKARSEAIRKAATAEYSPPLG